MSTKNHLTPTKKYKALISAIHAIYRLVNSTFELRDLVIRLARLVCQIFHSHYCLITLLDTTKEYSLLRCLAIGKKKYIIDKKSRISNRVEKRIIKKLSAIRQDDLLGIPLVCEDITGLIIMKSMKKIERIFLYDGKELMANTIKM